MGKFSLFIIINKENRSVLLSKYNFEKTLNFVQSPDLFEMISRVYSGKDFEENQPTLFRSLHKAQKQIDYFVNQKYSNAEYLEAIEVIFENNF